MGTVLGLDLGTNSIGWSYIEESEGRQEILGTGSRVFPMGVNMDRGRETSKNETRRDKRQSRRQNFRKKMRKRKLAKLMIEHSMFPEIDSVFNRLTGNNSSNFKFRKKFKTVTQEVVLPEELRKYFSIDPYKARAKAYEGEKLSLLELGRAFYHIAQRRGYRENLQDTDSDKGVLYEGDYKEGKTGIAETKEKVEEYGTLGNYLYHEDSHETRLRNRYTLRSMYEDEFKIIWKNQQKYYPDVLTESLRLEIGGSKRRGDKEDGVLFFQRPLRSQKHLIANCTFETHKPRSKQSIIPFELFRSFQLVNSIRVDDYPLDDEDRKTAVELLHSRKRNPKFATLRKKLSNPDGNYNYGDNTKLPSNNTIYNFRKIFGKKRWDNFSLKEQEEIWHIKYMADDPDWLEQYAKDKWGLSDEAIEKFKSFKLANDYANLSRKAIMNILPYLERGFLYDKAVLLGGLRGAYDSKAWDAMHPDLQEEIEEKILDIAYDKERDEKGIDQIKKLLVDRYGLPEKKADNLYHHSVKKDVEIKEKLPDLNDIPNFHVRNPIVQQALYEVRTVVNTLIDKYGRPGEIKVELARELKSSKRHREKIRERQQEREEENIEIKTTLDEYGLPHTRRNIHKVKLYNEIADKAGRAINPFNPEQTFGIEDLLGRDGYVQIEHIIPESVSLDDSLANKTLCGADVNREKGNKTPYQYFMSQGISQEDWEHYKDQVFDILPFYKAKKFTSEEEPELDDFIQRQLNDTRYISKQAKNYLKHICSKVTVAQGSATAMLRHHWGLNSILNGKYEVGNVQNGEYLAAVDSEDKIIELVEWNEKTLKKDQKRLEKKGQFLQGNVSNSIFYPFKQRNDHRHHAVDAITVACSKKKYLQQISRLSALGWNSNNLKQHYGVEQPWEGFWQDAKDAIDSILVSHKQNDRVLTKVKKQLYDYDGSPKTDDEENKLYAEGKAARGQLHEATIYGKHIGEDGKPYYHTRKKLEDLTSTMINDIVDPRIKELVKEAVVKADPSVDLNNSFNVPNNAFFEYDEKTKKRKPLVCLPNKNGNPIPVKKVRIRKRKETAEKLKDNINQFVEPKNNHHFVIYEDQEGKLGKQIVTFWEVVERQKQKQPVFKLPYEGKRIITTVQKGEMFLVGLTDVKIRDNIQGHDFIKDFLYRVQMTKVSGYNIIFRHHTASTLDDPTQMIGISSMGETKSGWKTYNPIKVKISPIGEIKLADK